MIGGVTEIQSILFKRDFGTSDAKKWLKKHGYKYANIEKTDNYLRFRQKEPENLKRKGYSIFRMLKITDDIMFVIAILKQTTFKKTQKVGKKKSKSKSSTSRK